MKPAPLLVLLTLLLASCAAPAPAPTATLAPSATPSLTPVPTSTLTPTPTVAPTPTPIGGGAGQLVFEYRKAAFQDKFPNLKAEQVVFTASVDGTGLAQVMDAPPGSYQYLEDISPDGSMLLIGAFGALSARGDLYRIDRDHPGPTPFRLAQALEFGGGTARFVDNQRVVYESAGAAPGTYLLNTDGSDRQKISSGHGYTLQDADPSDVYWGRYQKASFRDSYGFLFEWGDYFGLGYTSLNGSGEGKLESNKQHLFPKSAAYSPDGTKIAWIPVQEENDCTYLYFRTSDIRSGNYTQWAAAPFRGVYDWYRSGRGKTITMDWVKDYVRRCYILYVASLSDMDHPLRIPLLPPDNLLSRDFLFSREYKLLWSPDGSRVFLFNNGHVAYAEDWQGNGFYNAPVLYSVTPTDAQPILREWKQDLFTKLMADAHFSPLSFSPDGRELLLTASKGGPSFRVMDIDTGQYSDAFAQALAPDPNVYSVGNLHWLP